MCYEDCGCYGKFGCYGDTNALFLHADLSMFKKVEIIDQSDVTKLKGIVAGPPDTPFEGK